MSFTDTIEDWRGSHAEVWDYTTSHGRLRLKLQRMPGSVCILVTFIDCQAVRFTASWSRFDPVISVAPLASERWLISDDIGGFSADCGGAFVSPVMSSYQEIDGIRESLFDPNALHVLK